MVTDMAANIVDGIYIVITANVVLQCAANTISTNAASTSHPMSHRNYTPVALLTVAKFQSCSLRICVWGNEMWAM